MPACWRNFMTLLELRKYRAMPLVKPGMRVLHTHNDRYSWISEANSSGNLNITFDGDNYSPNCHPHWKMKYFDKQGKLVAEYDN